MPITFTLSDRDFDHLFDMTNNSEGYGFKDKDKEEIKNLLQNEGLWLGKSVHEILNEVMSDYWRKIS